MEALILENNLIKKYMPKYNILLRDDKTYPYIKVTTNEEFPRLIKTRKIYNDGAKYFGPYTDVGAVNQIIELLNDIYSLKRCSTQKFPKDFKPCLNYHINQCRGICDGYVDKDKYNEDIQQVINFLNGKNKKLIEYLNEKMLEESEALNFEKAAEYRDYIAAVDAIAEKQRVVLLTAGDMDVILAAKGHTGAHIIMFFIRNGRLNGRESFHLQAMAEHEEKEVVSGFIKQYYTHHSMIPKEIIVEKELPDYELTEKWLSMMRGSKVKILVPQKGDKKALLDLAKHDVIEMTKTLDDKARRHMERTDAINAALEQFFGKGSEELVKAPGNPKSWRIEAYDISNTGGVDSVGAMVVFEGSRPVKKDYRRFRIKTIEGPNDYGSLQEVLYRRFKRWEKGDKGFAKIPDLILMDGGKGQVSAAAQVLKAMKIDIPIAGMVKDDKHRTRALLYENKEIDLKMNPVLYKYIASIQEEVHRFAIEYHRGVRNRKLQRSVLDEIEGVGEKRKNALLAHFGSIEKIKEADIEELCAVPGMTEPVAKNIMEWSLKSSKEKPVESEIKNE
jgi:excinuclease ABC subunit C